MHRGPRLVHSCLDSPGSVSTVDVTTLTSGTQRRRGVPLSIRDFPLKIRQARPRVLFPLLAPGGLAIGHADGFHAIQSLGGTMLYYIILDHIIVYHVMLCYVVVCYVILYYIISDFIISNCSILCLSFEWNPGTSVENLD